MKRIIWTVCSSSIGLRRSSRSRSWTSSGAIGAATTCGRSDVLGFPRRLTLSLECSLRTESLELHLGMVHEAHRAGHRGMSGAAGDQRVHLLAYTAIRGMS